VSDTGTDLDAIERRLGRELSRLPEDVPDPAILADTERRADLLLADTVGERAEDGPRWRGRRVGAQRVLYAGALGAAALAVVALVENQIGPGDRRSSAAAGSPLSIPSAPSYWWLLLALALSALAVLWVVRLGAGRLVAVGVGLVAAGGLVAAVFILPYVRIGAELAATAPSIDGYELVEIDRPQVPPLDGSRLVTLRYETAEVNDDLTTADWGRFLRANGFDRLSLSAGSGDRCAITERDDQYDATYYCASTERSGRSLTVDGTVLDTDGLIAWPGITLPLVAGGVVLLLAALISGLAATVDGPTTGTEGVQRQHGRRQGRRWSASGRRAWGRVLGRNRRFGFAVLAVGAAVGLMLQITIAAVRLDVIVNSELPCEPSLLTDTDSVLSELAYHLPDSDPDDIAHSRAYNGCLREANALLVERGVAGSANWLFSAVVIIADFVAVVLLAVGWLVARPGVLSKRRWSVLAGLTALALLAAGAQIVYSETIEVVTVIVE